MDFAIGIICVLCILAVLVLYQKNQTLTQTMTALQASNDNLQALISSTKKDLLNQITLKDDMIKETNTLFNAYKKTQDALMASMKENPFKAQQAIELMNESADTIADAIIMYHTNLGQRPEQIQTLKYYYNGLKALFRNQDDLYNTYKAQMLSEINRNPGQYVSMFVQGCNQKDKYSADLYTKLVGAFVKCRQTCDLAATTSSPTLVSSTSPTLVSSTSPTLVSSTPTGSTQNCYETCDMPIPLIPFAMPTGPLEQIDTSSGYVSGNSNGILNAIGFNPYKQADGMLMVAALVTFVETVKKVMTRYCSLPINGNTIVSLISSIMDDLYAQVKFMRNSMMLPTYNFVSQMHR